MDFLARHIDIILTIFIGIILAGLIGFFSIMINIENRITSIETIQNELLKPRLPEIQNNSKKLDSIENKLENIENKIKSKDKDTSD